MSVNYPANPLPHDGKCPCSSCERRRHTAAKAPVAVDYGERARINIERESSRPVCSRCGDYIWSDYYEWNGDQPHHDRCP